MNTDPTCVFCRIVAGELPARKVFEDDEVLVFHDIHPWAPVHLLFVPRQHIASMLDVGDAQAGLLGRMLVKAPELMRDLGVVNGFRLVINTGADGGQEVPHLHLHAFGGPRPWVKG